MLKSIAFCSLLICPSQRVDGVGSIQTTGVLNRVSDVGGAILGHYQFLFPPTASKFSNTSIFEKEGLAKAPSLFSKQTGLNYAHTSHSVSCASEENSVQQTEISGAIVRNLSLTDLVAVRGIIANKFEHFGGPKANVSESIPRRIWNQFAEQDMNIRLYSHHVQDDEKRSSTSNGFLFLEWISLIVFIIC